MQVAMEGLRAGVGSNLDVENSEGLALIEAALMGSPQSAVGGPRRRKRTKYNPWQRSLLEKAYAVCKYPNVWTRETLAKALNVDDARIIVWFQNRRARYSRQSAGSRPRLCPTPPLPLTPSPAPPRPPSGTLHYPGPLPSPSPCSCRRPLGDMGQAVAPLPLPRGATPLHHWDPPKPEPASPAPPHLPCGPGQPQGWWSCPWAPLPPSPHPRYPVDEIEVDFTLADFNMAAELDLSQAL